jgi:hypothetical protein
MSVFDETFNMQEYLQKRLLEIEDLNSRRIYKELVAKIFFDLHSEIEKEYKSLEERVFGEVSMPVEGPEVITNIVDRNLYDVTDQFLMPMRPEDLKRLHVDSEALLESMRQNTPFFLYTVFLQADYLETCKFDNAARIFRGCIRTEHSEFTAQFFVRPNTEYRKKIEELYEIFQINYLPWRSVCAPYLFKLFDVFIAGIENWDAKETIIEARIDFEEYESLIRYDQVPLWNVSAITMKASTYPEPCIDKTNYEHCLFRKNFRQDTGYLVTNRNVKIINIRWINGDLLITCPAENPMTWDLYQFRPAAMCPYPNPQMRNGLKPTFAAKLRGRFEVRIKTKQEIARLLASLACADELELVDLRLVANTIEKETYCVDYFIADELRTGKWETALELDFKPKNRDSYLNRDIMSFMVSIVQRYFPEYECCGRLV